MYAIGILENFEMLFKTLFVLTISRSFTQRYHA